MLCISQQDINLKSLHELRCKMLITCSRPCVFYPFADECELVHVFICLGSCSVAVFVKCVYHPLRQHGVHNVEADIALNHAGNVSETQRGGGPAM